jgi:hypothetical protein
MNEDGGRVLMGLCCPSCQREVMPGDRGGVGGPGRDVWRGRDWLVVGRDPVVAGQGDMICRLSSREMEVIGSV